MRNFAFSLCSILSFLLISTALPAEAQVLPANTIAPMNQEYPSAMENSEVPTFGVDLENVSPEAQEEPQAIIPVEPAVEVLSPALVIEPDAKIDQAAPAMIDHSAFNRLKMLVGRWQDQGAASSAQSNEKIEVEYRITAGGNAVLEILFPGTSQEMTTLYFESNNNLMLTHYSMLGNRPNLELKNKTDTIYEFEFVPSVGINPLIDTHMHKLKISFIDPAHIKQEWVMFEAGKPAGSYSFQLTRVSAE